MRKIITYTALALLTFSMPAFCETTGANAGIPNAGTPTDTNSGDSDNEKAQPVPDVAPDIDVIPHSLPGDCKSIDDELARLEKFAKNPKATQKQIAANQGRVTQLKAARTDAQCDDPDALRDEPAAPAATTQPTTK